MSIPKTNRTQWDQQEIDRIITLINDLSGRVKYLETRVRSCEVEIDRLERNKADAYSP